MSTLPPGSKLGRFEIATVLGQGAMGVVYLANDPEIERPVAIKTVRPEAMRGESAAEMEARFLKEAKLAGRLQHPSIVTVYDVGRDRDVCFIAMEYVDGKPLTRYLSAADTLPLTAKIGIIRQVAEALAHAHERGVLHRDIKPGNILIAKDGRVKVTDFGIGKFTRRPLELTRTGQMVGSPAYMSPEQVRGRRSTRADLFSPASSVQLLSESPFPATRSRRSSTRSSTPSRGTRASSRPTCRCRRARSWRACWPSSRRSARPTHASSSASSSASRSSSATRR